ncbi:hypothetical protein EVAR_16527_1 [Eumeta japonica]|uniref:Uncharacterized protein n=1 Tax=Eumeta variegata TaxID=151549 RepID=A0A4C1U2S0_EUMVA|nr:hypothetical protein EVAR_16527_1 [Eumeta japonica]
MRTFRGKRRRRLIFTDTGHLCRSEYVHVYLRTFISDVEHFAFERGGFNVVRISVCWRKYLALLHLQLRAVFAFMLKAFDREGGRRWCGGRRGWRCRGGARAHVPGRGQRTKTVYEESAFSTPPTIPGAAG